MNNLEREPLWAQVKKNGTGIITLTIVAVSCSVAVIAFKRPGQMSVIEAQAMDMTTMVPPRGAVPVGITTVTEEDVADDVTYTGTVHAFADEDVHARIAGRITSMPVYPGDRVGKGQLLVQLDPPAGSEASSRADAARFSAQAAARQSDMAGEELSERSWQLEAASAAEQAARSEVEAAQAQLDFWQEQLKRQEQLFAEGIVSRRDYDRDVWEFKQARANFDLGKAKLVEAGSVKQARRSALAASSHHAGHQSDQARQARSLQAEAAAIETYTRIRAQDSGIVVERDISPGVVVAPGSLLLKLAHIDRVRVQAQVAEADIARIKLGNKVTITRSTADQDPVAGVVTAIFPHADLTARTFTVEALIENIDKQSSAESTGKVQSTNQFRLLPGQYVVMRIAAGHSRGPSVPTQAVVWRQGRAHVWLAKNSGSSKVQTVYTCPMHPEVHQDHAGACPKCQMTLQPETLGGDTVARLVAVSVGATNADKTEITGGVTSGDKVIYAGWHELSENTPVLGVEWTADGPGELPPAGAVTGSAAHLDDHHHQEQGG